MRSEEIRILVEAVQEEHGLIELYGPEPDDGKGICFKLKGIPATFSVIAVSGGYDIQIEDSPPGDYIYTAVVSLGRFLELVRQFRRPMDEWPV